MSRKLIKIPP